MGLQKTPSPLIHTKLRTQSTHKITAHAIKQNPARPYPSVPIKHGAKKQYAEEEDSGPVLGKDEIRFVQQVLGTFMYYPRAVDSTILVALSAIATEQQEPTKKTLERVHQFLDYCASNDNAILTYKPSDMVLSVHSDASYLSVSKARTRAG